MKQTRGLLMNVMKLFLFLMTSSMVISHADQNPSSSYEYFKCPKIPNGYIYGDGELQSLNGVIIPFAGNPQTGEDQWAVSFSSGN